MYVTPKCRHLIVDAQGILADILSGRRVPLRRLQRLSLLTDHIAVLTLDVQSDDRRHAMCPWSPPPDEPPECAGG